MQAGFESYRDFAPAGWAPPDELAHEHVEEVALYLARPETFARVEVRDGRVQGLTAFGPPAADRASRDGWLPDVHLRWLFVAQPRWGDGTARRLHALALAAMREQGVRSARLNTPAAQARARRFYEREGWRLRLEPFRHESLGLELVEYGLAPT